VHKLEKKKVSLKPVDRIEVVVVMDNYADALLPSSEIVTRAPHAEGDVIPEDTLLAEHGLCLMVNVYENGVQQSILFDAGYTKVGTLHNMGILGIDPGKIGTLVISHRHMDHTAGLYALLDRMSAPVSIVVHPEAFLYDRYVSMPDGRKVRFPKIMSREKLAPYEVEIVESENPLLIAGDRIAVTGEIERTTAFEKGMPNAFVEKNGVMEKDPVADDQALAVHLKEKGLVVISGCSHSGIINTVRYAVKLTGVEKVHAVLGGFHLTGPAYEAIIEDTISALKEMSPEVIVPMHCTGWSAINRFAEAFPSCFILNSVGSTFHFH
jgi:7,8-dihydropterin-6-yl-methyl-4-(beta-D-ribofuranosyl)aminobenzene 5'-phosphate synthase